MNPQGTNPLEDFKIIKAYKKLFIVTKPDIILGYTIKLNIYENINKGKHN